MPARPNATEEERVGILQALLTLSENGKLVKGAIQVTAAKFMKSSKTISRIWRRAQESLQSGAVCADMASRKRGNCGRKRKNRDEIANLIAQVPLAKRTTLRSLSAATKIPIGTLYNVLKEGRLKRVNSTVKPHLGEENKIQRLKFALDMLEPESDKFKEMFNMVHVDEKWFYLTKIKKKFYLVPEEEIPHRTVQSKRFITKVMFLTAVARPRWDPHRKTFFDGKIGIWPCIDQVPAQRSSKNRRRGTLVSKPFEVNGEKYSKLITEKVIPAIKEKWPVGSRNMNIVVQHDNAPPHKKVDEDMLMAAGARSDGFNISFMFQPPNSPDYNVLDLGFFAAIQSLQYHESPTNIDELIFAVEKSFEEMPYEKLDNVFLSLQMALESAMKVGGGNNYKLAHMVKNRLRREGKLPVTLVCSQEAIAKARETLENTA